MIWLDLFYFFDYILCIVKGDLILIFVVLINVLVK